MPIRAQRFFTVVCPVCKRKLHADGNGDAFTVFEKRDEAYEMLADALGETLDEKISYTCSDECGNKYLHRNCEKRPCEYCKSKDARSGG